MLASMPDATQWFHSRPPSAPVPIVCVGDWVKVGLQSERFWVRVAQKVAARTKKPECYHCIVDNTLRTVPSQLATLGDCITLTDACFLEVMTSADEQAVNALAQQQPKTCGADAYAAFDAAARAYVARRPRVPWPSGHDPVGVIPGSVCCTSSNN